jgi:hypothetical protein
MTHGAIALDDTTSHRLHWPSAELSVKAHRLSLFCLLPLLLGARCGSEHRVQPRPTHKLEPAVELPVGLRLLEIQFFQGLLTLTPAEVASCKLELDVVGEDIEQVSDLSDRLAPRYEQLTPDSLRLSVPLPSGGTLESLRTTWRLELPARTKLVVSTPRGSISIRGAGGQVTVQGGSGVIDARMDGGRAELASTSGSIILRGDYQSAELISKVGRIDAQLPESPLTLVDLAIENQQGETFVDLLPEQHYYLFFRGTESLVRCAPDVRLSWEQIIPDGDNDALQGRVGDLSVSPTGQIQIGSKQTVHLRNRPRTAR